MFKTIFIIYIYKLLIFFFKKKSFTLKNITLILLLNYLEF